MENEGNFICKAENLNENFAFHYEALIYVIYRKFQCSNGFPSNAL